MNPIVLVPVKEARITERELSVVQMMAEDFTTKEMALKLGVSHRTVEAFRDKIRAKLGCKSLTAVVYQFTKQGLLK